MKHIEVDCDFILTKGRVKVHSDKFCQLISLQIFLQGPFVAPELSIFEAKRSIQCVQIDKEPNCT